MIHTKLDQPAPRVGACLLCKQPLKMHYIWVEGANHWWVGPTVHEHCWIKWKQDDHQADTRATLKPIPEKFKDFDPVRFKHPEARHKAETFGLHSEKRVLAITGHPRQGKSRLMWAVIQNFFSELEVETGRAHWPDYYCFTELMTDYDRSTTQLLMGSQFLFVDDIGCVDSYGRDRAQLQMVIRNRIVRNRWTFLTIDNLPGFDQGLEEILARETFSIVIQ